MKIAAIIPARMSASRFPGKPLVSILGLPMIEHVRRRTQLIKGLDEVWVATCDEEIKSVVESFGGKAIMTSSKHERATDRIEEVSHKISADIFINVQGDEPMLLDSHVLKVVEPYLNGQQPDCSCLCYKISNFDDLKSLNVVKVVLSKSNKILYLSRAQIPGKETSTEVRYYKQSGIMAFTKKSLQMFSKLESTPLEKKESVDLLRLLENDLSIQAVLHDQETLGVDVKEQVPFIESAILNDPIQKKIFEAISKL